MQVFFSDIKPVIVSRLHAARQEILIAVSWLTDRELFGILLDQLQKGVKVSLITRNDYLNNHPDALPWEKFTATGGKLRFCGPGKMLHYKFAVIDRKVVIATSYNWTCFAGSNNRENILVIDEAEMIEKFSAEFEFLSSVFPEENHPPRITIDQVNEKLHGFYEITLADDEKNQSASQQR